MLLFPFLAALWLGPLPVRYEETAEYRWKHKPVLETRLLDDMESLDHWSKDEKCEMLLTRERAHSGTHSLRLRLKTRTPTDVLAESKRNFGYAGVYRKFPAEDWTRFNRISFWLYPDLPGWRVVNLRMVLRNEGREPLPDAYDNDGNTSFVGLVNHQWNHVVWEIPYLSRDKVTSLGFVCRRQGNEPEASDTLTFDIDHLTLDRVDADPYEGWQVAPNRLAFSHTGYTTAARKTAVATGLTASSFSLIDQATGEAVFTKPVTTAASPLGAFQTLDFSGFTKPGRYTLRAGPLESRSFAIGDDAWRGTIRKVLNFFYTERCGIDIPGVHRVCHRDWQGVHGNQRILINGGWHDAGDLSQGLVNTAEGVYAMLELADRLRARGDTELADALITEARWGLDWVHKTAFGDGYRVTWATMGPWTDGILGNNDDVTADAVNEPYDNFLAAATEARAAVTLKAIDPELAAYSLQMARRDWQFAVDKFVASAPSAGQSPLAVASTGILASLDLFRATAEPRYAAKALELAPLVTQSQERTFQGRTTPITGFFYRAPDHRQIQHYYHDSHEEAPIVALTRLVETFPDNPGWIDWYTTIALHSKFYLEAMSRFTEPYGVLPNSLYRLEEATNEDYRRQVLQGVPVGNGYYLRRFPVWFGFRGHYGTVLTAARALTTAARLRDRAALNRIAETQMQWVVGRNPFAMSTLFGEGYDYAPLYSAMSGHLVGALPVGIQTRGPNDAPYWPASNYPNWKEVWVHPALRWLSLLADFAAPPPPPPTFQLTKEPAPNGAFRIIAKGPQTFTLKTWNLEIKEEPGTKSWQAKPITKDAPTVAVVIPNGDPTQLQELIQ